MRSESITNTDGQKGEGEGWWGGEGGRKGEARAATGEAVTGLCAEGGSSDGPILVSISVSKEVV